MAHLIVREPGLVPFSIPLEAELCAGRFEKNGLVLRDHRASRRHVRFKKGKRGWEIEDLGSRHGTFVNGVRVDRQDLTNGDRVQLGSVILEFMAADERTEILYGQSTWESKVPSGEGPADKRIRLLYEITRAIQSCTGSEELVGRMLDTILDLFGCERGLAGIPAEQGDGIRHITRRRGPGAGGEIVLSRPTLDALLVQRQGIILRGVSGGEGTRSDGGRGPSAMGVPLDTGTQAIGFLYVDDRQPMRFAPQDLDYLIAIGRLCAAAIENAERFQQAVAAAPVSRPHAILGDSEVIQQLRAQIAKYAAAGGTNVLIHGESGTGKELIARALHKSSARAGRPFVAVNCAAIPDTTIESELFGHVKGAFTDAVRDRRGSFEQASGGTLFLDEIGDLSLAAQAKVLRAIQEGEILPVGAERFVRVEVRVLSATHKDLRAEIAAGRFREDLYYRIAVLHIEAPPLRQREGDVEVLAHGLLRLVASGMGKKLEGFTPAALAALRSYPWPGNVRELRNEVERAAINADSSCIDVGDLSAWVRDAANGALLSEPRAPLEVQFAAMEATEQRLVKEALQRAGGNVAKAARLLGITRIMMKRRMDRYGLGSPGDEGEGGSSGAAA